MKNKQDNEEEILTSFAQKVKLEIDRLTLDYRELGLLREQQICDKLSKLVDKLLKKEIKK